LPASCDSNDLFHDWGDVAATRRRLGDAGASAFHSTIGSVFVSSNNPKPCPAESYIKWHRFKIHLARWLHSKANGGSPRVDLFDTNLEKKELLTK
jgi:hypothetical protein